MTSTVPDDRNEERRRRVLLGPLPSGFLRADGTTENVDADYQAALALQQQLSGSTLPPAGPPLTARLSITIVQAKLVKNYGLTRMDPYVRLRVGHCIYETHTDPSGGKTPRWNKVIHCLLPPGVNSIYLEIFDECSFTMDELIAWSHITIPQAVLNGETHEDWYPLNGKQGDGVEGMINLVLSYSVGPAAVAAFPPVLVVPSTGMGYAAMPVYPAPAQYPQPQPQPQPPQQPPVTAEQLQQSKTPSPSPACLQLILATTVLVVPSTGMGYAAMPVYPAPAQYPQPQPQPQPPQQPPVTAEQLQQIEEMFPSIDKEVIRSVLEANRGNKDATINSLLQMSE